MQSLSRKGIRPDAVVGHSSGEIAAHYAAGALSLAEAITVAYYRGFATKKTTKQTGAMAAIGLGATVVAPFLIAEAVVVAV